jgi:hypothetical protein
MMTPNDWSAGDLLDRAGELVLHTGFGLVAAGCILGM